MIIELGSFIKVSLNWITACGCDTEGSEYLQCNTTGQCPCKNNVNGAKCTECVENTFNFPTCSSKKFGLGIRNTDFSLVIFTIRSNCNG